MSLSSYYLEYGSRLARLHRRRRRCRAYEPTSNTASRENHEKINSWVSFCFPYEYGAPLGGPSGRRSSAINARGDLFRADPDPTVVFRLYVKCWQAYTTPKRVF